MDYIKIPPNSKIVIGNCTLDPNIPFPVMMTEEDKKNGDVAISSIKAGLINAIAHKGSDKDKIANEHFDYYKNIILSEKDAVKNMLLAAKVRIEKKDYQNAEILLKAVCAIEKQEEAFILLSTVYAYLANENKEKNPELYEGYDSLILETLKSAHAIFKDSENVLYELASFHYREGNYDIAENYLDKFLEKVNDADPRKQIAQKLKVKCEKYIDEEDRTSEVYDLIMMDRTDEAETKAKALYDEHKNEYQFNLMYGWALRSNGKFKEAKEYLMNALKLGGNDAELYNELSLVEWETGDKELAKEYMQIASDLDEKSPIFVSNLALMCISTDSLEDAESAIYSLIKRDKNDPMIETIVKSYNQKAKEPFVYPHEDDEHDDSECSCGHHEHHSDSKCTCHNHGNEDDHDCNCNHNHKKGECNCNQHNK